MSKIPVFDIGDTLSAARKPMNRAVREVLREEGYTEVPGFDINRYNGFDPEKVGEWLEKEGFDVEPEKIVGAIRRVKRQELEKAGAFRLLERSSEIATPGLLSDNTMEAKKFYRQLLEDRGVEVDGFVVSEEVGVKKPDERIFQEFLDRRGVEGEECVYFGNRGD
ncbi:MAG: HAD family hydrolase, partial [Candidatus Nanohaloarchaea archaeon]